MDIIGGIILAIGSVAILVTLLNMIPPLPDAAVNALATAAGLAKGLNGLFPIGTIFTIFSLVLVIEGVVMFIRTLRWLWKRVRGGGGD